jgi:hypothetical protein
MRDLRNNGIISKDEYYGKTLAEAKQYAEDGGFNIRIVERNGDALMVTEDVKHARLNFRVRDGFIIDVFGG